MVVEKRCKDCEASDKPPLRPRPCPYPGPRCKTHWRAETKRRGTANHELAVQRTYGLTEGQYESLYLFQGGRCAICQRATGSSRRLSVDHDHRSGMVRGLLCRPCNNLLGHARDEVAFFTRAMGYLVAPPASRLIGDIRAGDLPGLQETPNPNPGTEVPDTWT